MSIEAIKSAEHEMGQVVVLFKNNRYVFNLVVRSAFDERPYLSNIESAIQALNQAHGLPEGLKRERNEEWK